MEIKSGWRTTEFWLALAAAIAGALMTAGVFAPGSTGAKVIGAVSMALASLGYSCGRSHVKGVAIAKAIELAAGAADTTVDLTEQGQDALAAAKLSPASRN